LSNRTTFHIFETGEQKTRTIFYKEYFKDFYSAQATKIKKKILWTLRVIEDLERIPEVYFKHLKGTDGLYEIRVQSAVVTFLEFSVSSMTTIWL
jgi:hypothetical protein